MPFVIGHNLLGYMPDPDSLYVAATLEDAREVVKYDLERWAEDCYGVPTDLPDERADLEEISASLAGSAETVAEWITEAGGYSLERGPDGNEYSFWIEPKTYAELLEDGWSVRELEDVEVYPDVP